VLLLRFPGTTTISPHEEASSYDTDYSIGQTFLARDSELLQVHEVKLEFKGIVKVLCAITACAAERNRKPA